MLKPMVAVTAGLAIVASSIVYAQERHNCPDSDDSSRFREHYRLSVDDIKAFADGRIAALKAGLQLTPDQDKNWPLFEKVLRELTEWRVDRIQARHDNGQQQPQPNPIDRLQRRADAMSQLGAALKHVADAGAPLYQSLSDAQKNRFAVLARFLGSPHMHARNGGKWREAHGGRFSRTDESER
jgi:zinc resistance-associated protein